MTSTLLKQSKSNFNTYFFNGLFANKKIFIINCILQLLGFPVISLICTLEASDNNFIDEHLGSGMFFIGISVFCIFASLFCGIIVALNNFSYLYKKSKVDMVYALPLKAKTRFISDYFSGLSAYLIPYVISAVISMLIFIASGICIDEMHYVLFDDGYFALGLKCAAAIILIMTMLYTLTVLVIQCCGTIFESLFNIFLINGLIPGMIMGISAMMFYNVYGMNIFRSAYAPLCCTSPFGGITAIVSFFTEKTSYSSNEPLAQGPSFGKWIVFFILITAIYFAIAMFLHLKRKAEDVSKPYVFKLLYYVSITSVMAAICLIARIDTSLIFPVVVFAAIVYMIFEVITNRGFKKFYKSVIKFVITLAGIFIIAMLSYLTNGFGAENHIPSLNSIKSASVNYFGYDKFINSNHYINYYNINFTDKKALECIKEVQKSAIDLHKSGEFNDNDIYYDYYSSYSYLTENNSKYYIDYPRYPLSISYNLKNGSHIYRQYWLTLEQAKMLTALDSTPEMSKFIEKDLYKSMQQYEYIHRMKKEVLSYDTGLIEYESGDTVNPGKISSKDAKRLAEAYSQDYIEMSQDDILRGKILYQIANNNYFIRDSFTRTLEVLKSLGIVPSGKGLTYPPDNQVFIYPPEGFASSEKSSFTASYGTYYVDAETAHTVFSDDFKKLADLVRSFYFDEEDCYVLIINQNVYVIPYEYSSVAEEIYNSTALTGSSKFYNLINQIQVNTINDVIELYQLEDDMKTYSQLSKLQELSYRDYDNYSSFDEYFSAYYGTGNMQSDIYADEHESWELWFLAKKFYGYNSLEEYKKLTNENESSLEYEWNSYINNFSNIYK